MNGPGDKEKDEQVMSRPEVMPFENPSPFNGGNSNEHQQ